MSNCSRPDVTEKQAKQAERSTSQQRPREVKVGKPVPAPPPAKAAQQAQAAKLLRDQELNRKQQEKAERKARAAQLRQLVEQLRVARPESDDYYNFVHDGKIRRLPVTPDLRARIVAGSLAIVRYEGHYDLVPADAVGRIRERDPDAISRILPPPRPRAPRRRTTPTRISSFPTT